MIHSRPPMRWHHAITLAHRTQAESMYTEHLRGYLEVIEPARAVVGAGATKAIVQEANASKIAATARTELLLMEMSLAVFLFSIPMSIWFRGVEESSLRDDQQN